MSRSLLQPDAYTARRADGTRGRVHLVDPSRTPTGDAPHAYACGLNGVAADQRAARWEDTDLCANCGRHLAMLTGPVGQVTHG